MAMAVLSRRCCCTEHRAVAVILSGSHANWVPIRCVFVHYAQISKIERSMGSKMVFWDSYARWMQYPMVVPSSSPSSDQTKRYNIQDTTLAHQEIKRKASSKSNGSMQRNDQAQADLCRRYYKNSQKDRDCTQQLTVTRVTATVFLQSSTT